MKFHKSVLWYGFLFTIIAGSLLHFAYDFSNNNPIVGLFAPVSESTWEHLKMLFFPMMTFGIVEYFVEGYLHDNFMFAKAVGSLVGMLSIVTIFYTYTSVLSKNVLILDILTFFIGVAVAYVVTYKIMISGFTFPGILAVGAILIIIIAACFMVFTYNPPNFFLFKTSTFRK